MEARGKGIFASGHPECVLEAKGQDLRVGQGFARRQSLRSPKVTSFTMVFSSKTVPHWMQTASPRAASVSMSVDWQLGQVRMVFFCGV